VSNPAWLVVYAIDAGLTNWINSWSGQGWYVDQLFKGISSFGIPILVIAIACQWWSQRDRGHTRHVLLAAGFSFLLGLSLNQLILLFIHRVRSYDAGVTNLLIAPSGDPSFPSDHATAAFAIATVFLAYHFRGAKILLVTAILISLSRIYVGTHFVSDIIGGAITWMLAAGVIVWVYREGCRADQYLKNIL
jgi:undecaprenyl-diphosphatase